MWDLIDALVAEGVTTVLTTQYLEEADRLAHQIVVVDHGKVIAEGTPDALKDRVGGERLEGRLGDASMRDAAVQALAPMADDAPGGEGDIVTVGVRGRSGT